MANRNARTQIRTKSTPYSKQNHKLLMSNTKTQTTTNSFSCTKTKQKTTKQIKLEFSQCPGK